MRPKGGDVTSRSTDSGSRYVDRRDLLSPCRIFPILFRQKLDGLGTAGDFRLASTAGADSDAELSAPLSIQPRTTALTLLCPRSCAILLSRSSSSSDRRMLSIRLRRTFSMAVF